MVNAKILQQRIGFGRRSAAALIDAAATGIFSLLVGVLLSGMFGMGVGWPPEQADGQSNGIGVSAIVGALGGVLIWSYVWAVFGLCEVFAGASPGKMLLGLTIGQEDGTRASVSAGMRRWAVKYSWSSLGFLAVLPGLEVLESLPRIVLFVIFIGCFLVLGDKRQALHDLAAKTAVFNKADLV